MKTAALEKPAWLAPGLRFLLLGLVTLLLLCAPARGQSLWPQEDLGKTAAGVGKSGRPPSWRPCRQRPFSSYKPTSASIWKPGRRPDQRLPKLGRNMSQRMGKTVD
ncbi:MAG: hypothetical protein FJ121_09225 [Deltaproteobacteria bacterium]|nr:hypothetical protein [Deltaproteobacteria bacterium]